MISHTETLKELEAKVSKAVADLVSVSCADGEECEEAQIAKEKLALAEKELNDFKCAHTHRSASDENVRLRRSA
jgi:hypothetical protein